jgi:hypothetical protein
MNRREFLRALSVAVAAILAGEPIAPAFAAALERERRRALILEQLTYQALKSGEAAAQFFQDSMYGTELEEWPRNVVETLEFEELHELGPSAFSASYSFDFRIVTI